MTTPSSAAVSADTGFARRHRMLPVVLVAMFMAQFDLYVVNVALPVLQHRLDASDTQLQLFVGGYAFMYAAGLIAGGRLGDHFGHARMFRIGMAAFGAASLACGLSGGPDALVGFRLAQGATAALLVPQVLALITRAFPAPERAKALSWFGVVMGVGAVAGQVLGGVLLQLASGQDGWRVVFLVNVPIAVLALLAARGVLPERRGEGQGALDVPGMILISCGLALVLFPFVVGRSEGWPAWSGVLLGLAVPAFAAAVLWERRVARGRSARPVLPVELFRERAFVVGLALSVVLFSAFFAFVFCITLVLQNGLGLDPLAAGLTFGPLGVAFAGASIGARTFIARFGARVIVVGAAIVVVGLALALVLLRVTDGATTAWQLAVPMAVVGLGNGVAVPAVIGQVLARIEPVRAGAASGLLSTAQQFSSALGIAVIGGLFFGVLSDRPGAGAHEQALQSAVSCSLALAGVAVVLAVVLVRTTRPAAR